jgi:hypothetical protein
MIMTPPTHHQTHTTDALAILLATLIGLWVIVGGGLQRQVTDRMLLPEAPPPSVERAEPAAEPYPLPGGEGHLELEPR